MLKKTITYTDYDGKERTGTFYFHLNKPELMEMKRSPLAELKEMLQNVLSSDDPDSEIPLSERDDLMARIGSVLRDLIIKSYGKKTSDGMRFVKRSPDGASLGEQFVESAAYEELYMELISDDGKLLAFIKNVIPTEYADRISKESGTALPADNVVDIQEKSEDTPHLVGD